jgi:uncharacterized protein GlcG (DUF336 family)
VSCPSGRDFNHVCAVSLGRHRPGLCIGHARERAIAHAQGPVRRYGGYYRANCHRHLRANGYRVSATVVGRNGEVLVQIRGDGTPPHTMENSFKKAYTSRTFRIPSGEMEERLKKNPQMGAQYLTGFTTGRGALPIKVGEEVIGAAGASGAPGGEKDEACIQAAIDKVADQLK